MRKNKMVVLWVSVLCLSWGMFFSTVAESKGIVLSADFESRDYKKIFPEGWGSVSIEGGGSEGKCLQITKGSAVKTKRLVCPEGELKVALDLKLTDMKMSQGKKYRVCWISVQWFDSEAAKKPSGHSDVIVAREASDWKRIEKTFVAAPKNKYFQVSFFNAASAGTIWIDHVEISTGSSVVKRNLLGDPSFEYAGRLGADNWFTPKSGTDWDGFSLFTEGAVTEITDAEKVSGGSALHLKGNATVVSARFLNDGGEVSLSGWIKTKEVTPGRKKWCKAGVQIVYYNDMDQIVGHNDLKLLAGTHDWKRYEYTTVLPRNITGFEVWVRIFEAAGGEVWFDEFFLHQEQSRAKAYDSQNATVTVDADHPEFLRINPVWANGVILYPGWITHPVGQQVVPMVRAAGITSLRTFESLQGGQILKEMDADGNPVYDWTRLDEAMDLLVTNGIDPLVTIECTPNQISSRPDKDNEIYTNKYPPEDYDLWGRITEDMLVHFVERYGKDNVSRWYFDIWNEPETTTYFKGTLDEYLKIYDQALDALLHVEKRFGIHLNKGTMSSSLQGYFRPLFDHLHEKGMLQHVDFLSFHVYAGTKLAFSNYEREINRAKATRDSYEELVGKPLLITEYNGNTMPGEVYRDNHVLAALVVKCARVFLDTGIERAYFHSVIDYPHAWHKNKHFRGSASLITKSGIPIASYNAFLLLDKLKGGRRIALETSNEPLDGIAVIAEDGSLRVLLTSFDDAALDTTDPVEVSVAVDWKNMPEHVKATMIRLDENHGNAYTEFLALGEPKINDPSHKIQQARMLDAAKLQEEGFSGFTAENGKLKFNLNMKRNAVVYLKFL